MAKKDGSKSGGDVTQSARPAAGPVYRDAKGRLLPGSKLALGNRGPWGALARVESKRDLIALLRECVTDDDLRAGFAALAAKIARGERWALEFYFAYILGTPVQRRVNASKELIDLLRQWQQPAAVTVDVEPSEPGDAGAGETT